MTLSMIECSIPCASEAFQILSPAQHFHETVIALASPFATSAPTLTAK